MPNSDLNTHRLSLELLRIKHLIRKKQYRSEDVETYRFCLTQRNNLSIIATGYVLSESFAELSQTAISVISAELASIAKDGPLPNKWCEIAMLEGLVFIEQEELLKISNDTLYYLRILLQSSLARDDQNNLLCILHRLAKLGVDEAAKLVCIRDYRLGH